MSILDEGDGKLNAFAKEPQIEVIQDNPNGNNGFRLLLILGAIIIACMIAVTVTTS